MQNHLQLLKLKEHKLLQREKSYPETYNFSNIL